MSLLLAALAALSVSPALAQSLVPPPPPPGIECAGLGAAAVGDPQAGATAGGFSSRLGDVRQRRSASSMARPMSAVRCCRAAPAMIRRPRPTPSIPPAITSGTSATSSAICGRRCRGDVSLAASVSWPNMNDFHDRKVVLIIRDSLDDDSRQIMAAQHGSGMVHIAWRPEKGGQMTDVEYRSQRQPAPATGEKGPQIFHPSALRHREEGRCTSSFTSAGRASRCMPKARR